MTDRPTVAQATLDILLQDKNGLENQITDINARIFKARKELEEEARKNAESIPVDRNARQLSGGKNIDGDHREIDPITGQQKGYIVLTQGERDKGFVRPVRDAYRHAACRKITTMSRDIAETYARDPFFYSGTFCTTCRAHFPIGEDGEFTWYEMDGSEGPKVGT